MARKQLGKKLRFEVFKRDSFKCQYCGRSAPDVVLEADHVHPVSRGGQNDILNLITSCKDCNAGKSDRALTDNSAVEKQRRQLQDLNERRDQLRMMLKWRRELASINSEAVESVAHEWSMIAKGFGLNELGRQELRKLLQKYGAPETLAAMEIADRYISRKSDGSCDAESVHLAWSKIPAILAMRAKPEAEQQAYYVRGILKNRLRYVDFGKALALIKCAARAGRDMEELKDIARSAQSWSEWLDAMDRMLEGAGAQR